MFLHVDPSITSAIAIKVYDDQNTRENRQEKAEEKKTEASQSQKPGLSEQ